jgi:NitT/TauT family transport system substrate-binding protein
MPARAKLGLVLIAALALTGSPAGAGEEIVAAVNRLSAGAPLYIALDKGLFTAEGLDVELTHLTSSQTIGLAVVAADAQFGMTAITAGIYTLAQKGGLKMIAGGYEEHPGFHGVAIVANRGAYERGLKAPADLAGKRIAITAVGSGSHNQLARLAQKYGFPVTAMQLLPLQTLANEVSAVSGGQVDATLLPATLAEELEHGGKGKIIAWMGDEVPTQFGGIFASPATIVRRRPLAEAFLRATVAAMRLYDRAFQQRGADGKPMEGPEAADLLRIIAAHTGETPAALAAALPYFDPDAALHVDDIAEQIAVYKSLRLVDPALSANAVLDRTFVPLRRLGGR